MCPQELFWVWKLRRIKETLLTSVHPWPHPLSFLYCVFFFAPWALWPKSASHCFITATDQPPRAGCFPRESWRREILKLSNKLLQIFIIYWYIWKYICIHFKFHIRDYWTLYGLRSGLILLWQDICSHKRIHNSLVSNSQSDLVSSHSPAVYLSYVCREDSASVWTVCQGMSGKGHLRGSQTLGSGVW